jgi:hypothetical protein
MVAVLGLWYLRKADREFDPLAEAVIEKAMESELLPANRFARKPAADTTTSPEVQA